MMKKHKWLEAMCKIILQLVSAPHALELAQRLMAHREGVVVL